MWPLPRCPFRSAKGGRAPLSVDGEGLWTLLGLADCVGWFVAGVRLLRRVRPPRNDGLRCLVDCVGMVMADGTRFFVPQNDNRSREGLTRCR